jgi:mRNA interferase MazF
VPFPDEPPKRGEIYWIDLGQARGSEQSGRRPALVISPSVVNKTFPVVVVAAMTSKIKVRGNPISPILPAGRPLPRESCVMSWQVFTVSNERLSGFAGSLTPQQQAEVDVALRISFGLGKGSGGPTPS